MTHVLGSRAALGAVQNKLQSAGRSIDVTRENLAIARSRIADTDLAAETSELVKTGIKQGAGISMLAQANLMPQQALKLL